jgi:replicative DNA helicase
MQPLDNLFLAIGNELIDILDGFTNNDSHNAVVDILKQDMSEVIELVKQSGSIEIQDKIEKNLNRLQALNNKYNSAEGIVFMYKGRLMKLTGSFAAINQILGARFDVEKLNNII